MAGASSVFLAHRSDESFADADELSEATHLPLLGSVSEIVSERQRRDQRIRNLVIYPLNALAIAGVLLLLVGVLYLSLERPESYELLKHHPTQFIFNRVTDASAGTPRE
jgi:hypothetical protein